MMGRSLLMLASELEPNTFFSSDRIGSQTFRWHVLFGVGRRNVRETPLEYSVAIWPFGFNVASEAGNLRVRDIDENSQARVRFADRVFAVVAQIPEGTVTTYGEIARALGAPRGARQVGWAIASASPGLDLPFHRVVNREGFLSGGWAFGHPEVMKQRLVAEEVPFRAEYTVDLAQVLWIPDAISASPNKVDDFEDVTVINGDGGKR